MYRQLDIDTILNNIDRIEDQAKTIYLNKYEPTMEESKSVYRDIKQFIRDKNRIVYGGYAQNELINVKNKEDVFYREIDLADIEFYTPDPVGDMIDLCDLLLKKKYKYIDGKEGVHNETYKIFVNFINYCDISYMPPEIYNTLPTITIDGLKLSHPHFMLIDAYRVYTDPMTSYFRLKKTFTRFTKLIKYYPFNENMTYNKIEYKDKIANHDVLKFIRRKIIRSSDLIVLGHFAFNRLMKKAEMADTYFVENPFFQLISTNYSKDIDSIHNLLRKKYPTITKKTYYPFGQYLDKSSEWYIDNILILRIYGNYDRCTVYRKSHKKIKYATFQLQFMYCLIHYNMGIIRKNKFNEIVYGTMLVRLLKARDKYLITNNKTVMDDSPFQEFVVKCIGEPKDLLRSSFLDKTKKRESGKKTSFFYKPSGSPGKKPIFKFDDTSGTIKK
jgi:hypothetical protein